MLSKKRALETLDQTGRTLDELICNCVLYGDSTNKLNYWISDIASWIYYVNNTRIGLFGFKLRSDEYSDNVFRGSHRNSKQTYEALELLSRMNVAHYSDFPYVDVNTTTVSQYLKTTRELALTFGKLLSKRNNLTRDLIEDRVKLTMLNNMIYGKPTND